MRVQLVTAAVLGAALGAPAAAGAATCQFDGATRTVTFQLAAGEAGSLAINGTHLVPAGTSCGVATTKKADRLVVLGTGGDERFLLGYDTSLGPGHAAEPGGQRELETVIDLGEGNDAFQLVGTSGRDRWTLGDAGLAVNRDADVDVTFGAQAPESIILTPGAGRDDVLGDGGFGAGGPAPAPFSVFAGPGRDHVRGGDGVDFLDGEAGADVVEGFGPSGDTLRGGDGPDALFAAAAGSFLLGGPGDDVLHAQNGVADGVRGDEGNDTAELDCGLDVDVLDVETTGCP